ncbi:hypothetical protein Bpfe_025559, partial [Biomphalaria pfeifferi]
MTARSVLLLFPFIMYFAHRTDGCQSSMEATEMQWLEEELADWKLAPHNIKRYTNAILTNRRFISLKSKMDELMWTLVKEFSEKARRQEIERRVSAQREILRQRELRRQKE